MRLSLIAAVLLMLPCASAQTRYSITDLGTLDSGVNYPSSVGRALNDGGVVVGISFVRSSTLSHSFAWDGAIQDLGTLKADGGMTANAVNAIREIVGKASDPYAVERAYRWSPVGGIQLLLPYRSEAMGINEGGQVVGWFTSGGPTKPFLVQPDGSFLDLGLPANALNATAQAINDLGTVVGTFDRAKDRYPCKAFTWSLENGFREVFPKSNACTVAYAINNPGQIAGYQYSAAGWKGFIYDPSGKTTYFTVKNSRVTVYGLNDLGTGVGTLDDRAAMFQGTEIIDLNSLLPPGSGWQLVEALDINNRGEITGSGIIGGQRHAFLLTPIG